MATDCCRGDLTTQRQNDRAVMWIEDKERSGCHCRRGMDYSIVVIERKVTFCVFVPRRDASPCRDGVV